MTNRNAVVIIPAKNEGERIKRVLMEVAKSPYTKKIVVVDGHSSDNTRAVAEQTADYIRKKYGIDFELLVDEYRHGGKGIGMMTGMKHSLNHNPGSVVCFFDADISTLTSEWVDKLVEPILREKKDMCRGFFDRTKDDALITKHVTRPLIALFFPELSAVRQPLGGELSLSPALAEALLTRPVAKPTCDWGIDTWFILNTFSMNYSIKEVYLGEKIHKPKDPMQLEGMLKECFRELVELADKTNRLEYYPAKFQLSFYPESKYKVRYMTVVKNLKKNMEFLCNSGWNLALLKDKRFEKFYELVKSMKKESEAIEKLEKLTAEDWIKALVALSQLYVTATDKGTILDLAYKLWLLYSLSYILFHTASFKEAEEYVDEQCRLAFGLRKKLLF